MNEYRVLLEVTVLSKVSGAVSVQLKEVEFKIKICADQFIENLDVYEESPELKIWRLATKLYY